MKQVSDVHGTSRHTKIIVSQFWRFDDHEVTKRLPVDVKHARFATVSDVRPARSDESVRGRTEKFAVHHSFERPTIKFFVKACSGHVYKICISPQF